MNSPAEMQGCGPQELSGRTEYCNLGDKKGVKQGDLRGEEAAGEVWNYGMCTCAFTFSTQHPANTVLGYRALFCVPV